MSFIPQQLKPGDIEAKEKEFRSLLDLGKEEEKMWADLHGAFKDDANNDQAYWYTYFRWYTELTWRRLEGLNDEEFFEIVVARQIPMAILTDHDVWNSLLWTLSTRWYATGDMADAYQRIRDTFSSSKGVLGQENGKSITLADLFADIRRLNDTGNDSFQMVALRSRIKNLFYPASQPLVKYLNPDQDTAVRQFIDLNHFFLGTEVDDITAVVDIFLHPENYTAGTAAGLGSVPTPPASITAPVQASTTPPAPAPVRPRVVRPPKVAPSSPAEKPLEKKKMSYPDIRAMVDSRFEKDEKGQYKNIAGVAALLEQLAKDQNDPAIEDLYYFDERTGKFRWNF